MQQSILFTLSVGLFDKETKTQLIGTNEAFNIINEKCANTFIGATVTICNGVYKHDDGKNTIIEPSIKIELLLNDSDRSDVIKFAKWSKKRFNQESILYIESLVYSQFI